MAEWMEGEKLGAVRGREERGGGGPLKERESDGFYILSSFQLRPLSAFHPLLMETESICLTKQTSGTIT